VVLWRQYSHSYPSWRVTSRGNPLASCSMSESVSGETHPPGPRHWVSQLSALRELNGPGCEINVKGEGSNPIKAKVRTLRSSPASGVAIVTRPETSTGRIPRPTTTDTRCSGLDLKREKRTTWVIHRYPHMFELWEGYPVGNRPRGLSGRCIVNPKVYRPWERGEVLPHYVL
jgi:hypothetical protein